MNWKKLATAGIVIPWLSLLGYVFVLHLTNRPVALSAADWSAGKLWWSRLLLQVSAVAVLGLLIVHQQRVAGILRNFFTTPGSAIDLGVFRVVVFYLLIRTTRAIDHAFFVNLPETMIIPPGGVGWLPQSWFFNHEAVTCARWIFFPAAALAMLGLFTRFSTVVATLSAAYLAALPHFDGKVDHGGHHLIWFACILAVSRCGDAFAADRVLFRRPIPARSVSYAVPLRFCWLLFGVLYFFPGFWKVWCCGLEWALSDNLKLEMYSKWTAIGNWMPEVRVDQYTGLCQLLALGTLLFEMGFLFCMFFRPTRCLAAFIGLSFHYGVRMCMRINFANLMYSYAAFVPWSRLAGIPEETDDSGYRKADLAPIAMGCLLLVGNLIAGGMRGVEAYPFTCYPTFNKLKGNELVRLEMKVLGEDGTEQPVNWSRLAPVGTAGGLRIQRRIMEETDPARQQQMIRDLQQVLGLSPHDQLIIDKIVQSTDPETRAVVSRERIFSTLPMNSPERIVREPGTPTLR